MKTVTYVIWCIFGVFGSIALLICIVVQAGQNVGQIESSKQAVYQSVKTQIESANSHPVIIMNGEYSATRCENPYGHCVKMCKLQKFSFAGIGDEGMRKVWKK